MNLYVRYFDAEVLVHTVEEVFDFLSSIPEIDMNSDLEQDLREYVTSNYMFPKRYKVRPKVYFIVIKTEAANLEDFKNKKALRPRDPGQSKQLLPAIAQLNEQKDGWYEGRLDFKRVLMVPGTGKFQYKDSRFVARMKAHSGMDCYNRIVDYLSSRVDSRSQFPAAKGKNFKFEYLGGWK